MKIIKILMLLFNMAALSSYAQNTTTLPANTVQTTPQFRITEPADSLRQTWVNFPFYGTNRFYSATEINNMFLSPLSIANSYASTKADSAKLYGTALPLKVDSANLYGSILPQYALTDSLIGAGVDVTKFGVRFDSLTSSATNNSRAFAAADAYAAARHLPLIMPKGTAFVDSTIYLHTSLKGQGSQNTTIYTVPTTDTNRLTTNNTINVEGKEIYLGKLSTPANRLDTSLSITTNVDLKRGDLIMIRDTVNSSYSYVRTAYKEGQIIMVRNDVNAGNKIVLDQPIVSNYKYPNQVQIYKMEMPQVDLNGFTLIGRNHSIIYGIQMIRVRDSKMEDVIVSGAARSNFSFTYCYNLNIDRCNSKKFDKDQNPSSPTSYGISLVGGDHIQVSNCNLYGSRHAFATMSGYTTRFINIDNCTFSSTEEFSFNLHGSSQYATISNSFMQYGASFGGKDIKVYHNVIQPCRALNGIAISVLEACGMNWDFENNTIYAEYQNVSSYGVQIRMDGRADTTGRFVFRNNTVRYDNSSAPDGVMYTFRFEHNATNATPAFKLLIDGNEWYTTDWLKETRIAALGLSSTYKSQEVTFSNNISYGASAYVTNYLNQYFENNKFQKTKWYGLVSSGADFATVLNNTFREYCLSGTTSGSAGFNSAYRVTGANTAKHSGNIGTGAGTSATAAGYFSSVTNLYTGINSFTTTDNYASVTNQFGFNYPTVTIAKGGTGLNTIGSAGQILRVNSGASGLEWASPASTSLDSALLKNKNLFDVPDKATALNNLGGVSAMGAASLSNKTISYLNGNNITINPLIAGTGLKFDSGSAYNAASVKTLSLDYSGYKRLIASGTGSATTITIAHGVSGVSPSSVVLITPKNAASGGFNYATADATNIYITYTTAPASGSNNLSYDVMIKP